MKNVKSIRGGYFITFEGIEGSGKSTQAKVLSEKLKSDGYDVLTTREPGGTKIGEQLRGVVQHVCGDDAVCNEAELLIFCASRAQLFRKRILPHLERGGIVICDRFVDSTTAYQGYGRHMDLSLISNLHRFTTNNRWPDITILLDLDVMKGLERTKLRAQPHPVPDRFENEPQRFHQRVRDGFLKLAELGADRFKIVQADQEQGIIHQTIMEIVYDVISGV